MFSTQHLVYPQADGNVCNTKENAEEQYANGLRLRFGAITMVTGTFAFVAVSRVLTKLAAKPA